MAATLNQALAAHHLGPLWERYKELVTHEPRRIDPPFQWRWADMVPMIERAAREVPMENAERRVLMLVNPAFDGRVVTTTNIFAGLQILLPGESARPHRHTASALRFMVEGDGAATVVNGKRCLMRPGDLILTPSWTWHAHENPSGGRVVWLDGLDLPLMHHLDVNFGEGGPPPNEFPHDDARHPDAAFGASGLLPEPVAGGAAYSPMFRYPWTATAAALAAQPARADGSRRLRFTSPLTGGAVMPTLDCYAWEFGPTPTARARSTCNAVCLVIEGEGRSEIGGATLSWGPHDVFTVPHWTWASHRATAGRASLFMMTDREILKRLALLREEEQA